MDRFILPKDEVFVRGTSVHSESISLVEGVFEEGELTVKPLMIGTDMLFLEAFKGKGMTDPMHQHDDHESVGYLISGKLRLVIGGVEYIAEPGDTWKHPRFVSHLSEALEDSIQLEVKSPPRKTWYTDVELKES